MWSQHPIEAEAEAGFCHESSIPSGYHGSVYHN